MANLFSRSSLRWFPVFNADTEPAPPFALLAITDVDATGNMTVTRPTADSQFGLLVNGPGTIPAGMFGQAHQTFPAIVAYSDPTGQSEPTNGQTWGSVKDSWTLQTGQQGYLIVGGGANGLVNVNAPAIPLQAALVKI